MRLRAATSADDGFCFRLNEASLREYVEPIYGWDPDLQRRHHAEWFEPERLSIIEDDEGKAIGLLEVLDRGDHLYLNRIELMPEAQGHGVGTSVVADVIRQGRTVRLHVFTNNVRARRFYERLGFTVDHVAEREHHVSMHHPGATPGQERLTAETNRWREGVASRPRRGRGDEPAEEISGGCSVSAVTRFVVDCPTLLRIAAGEIEVAAEHQLVAPTLVRSQALAALYEAARRGEISAAVGLERLTRINSLKVRFLGDKVLQRTAWRVADQLGRETTSDAEFVALTQLQADALVTSNEELARAASRLVQTATIDALRRA